MDVYESYHIKNTAYFFSDIRACFNRKLHVRGTRRVQRNGFLHKKTLLNPISQQELSLSTVNTEAQQWTRS